MQVLCQLLYQCVTLICYHNYHETNEILANEAHEGKCEVIHSSEDLTQKEAPFYGSLLKNIFIFFF